MVYLAPGQVKTDLNKALVAISFILSGERKEPEIKKVSDFDTVLKFLERHFINHSITFTPEHQDAYKSVIIHKHQFFFDHNSNVIEE